MIQFGWIDWIEYDLVVFAFQPPHNLLLLALLNYAATCGMLFFLGSGETCIVTKKLTEIRVLNNCCNQGEIRKSSFKGGLPYEGEARKFSFSGRRGLLYQGRRGNFLVGDSHPSAYYTLYAYLYKINILIPNSAL